MKNKYLERIYNGVWKENPLFVLVLGTCPTLAVTTSATNGIGMGLAATAVLILSNILISALRNVIPGKVRLPAEIVVVASLVTVCDMLMEAFTPDLYKSLGIFIPLIVVNCIILGRAEAFALKNSPLLSAFDGLGMGLGFTLALVLMASFREILGNASWAGNEIAFLKPYVIPILTASPGGFFAFGVMIALVAKLTKGKSPKKKSFDCECCPNAAACGKVSCVKEDATNA